MMVNKRLLLMMMANMRLLMMIHMKTLVMMNIPMKPLLLMMRIPMSDVGEMNDVSEMNGVLQNHHLRQISLLLHQNMAWKIRKNYVKTIFT